MATPFPFSFLGKLLDQSGTGPWPPVWLVDDLRHRATLFLNHVLMQEPQARRRLTRQQGKAVLLQWRAFTMKWVVTPAGLLERTEVHAEADLRLTIGEESPLALAQAALSGGKPALRVEGDAQLAAEVNWLVEHLRWDVEEDLSRLIGDAPAHVLGQGARRAARALRALARGRAAPAAACTAPLAGSEPMAP